MEMPPELPWDCDCAFRRANGEVRTSTARRDSGFCGWSVSCWVGSMAACRACAQGKLIFADGSMYEGQFDSDRKHGTGKPVSWSLRSGASFCGGKCKVHLQQWLYL